MKESYKTHFFKCMIMIFFPFSCLSLSCLYSYSSNGDTDIISLNLRPKDCVIFDFLAPSFYSFSTTNSLSITRYSSNSNFTKFTLDYEGSTPEIAPTDRVLEGKTRLVFMANNLTHLSIGYASLDSFNCSKIIIDNSKMMNSSPFLNFPIDEKYCFFYASTGLHTIKGSFGACKNCPEFIIYSGVKHRLAIVKPETYNFNYQQVIRNKPTLIVIYPPKERSDVKLLSFTLETDNFYSNTSTYVKFSTILNGDETVKVFKVIGIGKIISIIFISFCSIGIIMTVLYAFQKEKSNENEFGT